MRIAVVGSGISGNLAARILSTKHTVHLFEAAGHVGGHAQTVDVQAYDRDVSADVAFMVYNRKTYPNFCRMLEILEAAGQDSDMSLSVRCCKSNFEFQGSSLGGLFAQRSNLVKPSFYKMLWDIVRFNKHALRYCDGPQEDISLGEFLNGVGLGKRFREHYLIPMSAAIWSADPSTLYAFPAKFILGFLRNHGLLQVSDRPQWLTPARRSRNYVQALIPESWIQEPAGPLQAEGESATALNIPPGHAAFVDTPVERVRRMDDHVQLTLGTGQTIAYDHVVLGTHSDQALALLEDADSTEQSVLSAIPYQTNWAVLHTDASILPNRRAAWASWNYHIGQRETNLVSVTYDLNRLQTLNLPGPLCLTLNPNREIDGAKVLQTFEFEHPVFSAESVNAQQRHGEINGKRGVSFCGAYWGYGFHEDGVNSALAVTKPLGLGLEDLGREQFDSSPGQLESASLDSAGSTSVEA